MRLDRGFGLVMAVVLATLGAVSTVAAADDALQIEPAKTVVARDSSFTIRIVQRATVPTSGAQATVIFDPSVLQVTAVTPAAPYATAPLFLGAGAQGISAANKSGKLKTVAAAFLPPAAVPAGEQEFLHVAFKAIGCGRSDLALPAGPADGGLLDGSAAYGRFLTVEPASGAVVVDCGASSDGSDAALDGSESTVLITLLIGLAVLVTVGAGLVSMRRRA